MQAGDALNSFGEEEEVVFEDDQMDYGVQRAGEYAQGDDFDDDDDVSDALLDGQQDRRQEQAQIEALAGVPDPVKKFIVHFYNLVKNTQATPNATSNAAQSGPGANNGHLSDLHAAYEQGWTRLTEKFYSKQEWPEAETIAPLVNHDELFLTLYRELYYRHVYARLQPDLDDRFQSYDNYCALFNLILNSPGPLPLALPIDWVHNIIDEFLYQYTSFVLWRSKVNNKSDDEKAVLAESGQAWSCYSVLNVLYSLIQKSKIQDVLKAQQKGLPVEDVAGEYGSIQLYYHLGYFSILGLVRVHVLLGDYALALSVLDGIDLNKKALFTRVTGAHVALYYYVGFSYLMLQRYPDAIRSFSHVLFFINRLKHFQRGSQFDTINKTADRMYALLAIAQALAPTKIDEGISSAMKERYGEQFAKMVRGGDDALPAFVELFNHGSPRFISPTSPPYELESDEALAQFASLPDMSAHQTSIFVEAIKPRLVVANLRSFLRLYTTLGTDKLAKFLGVDEQRCLELLMIAQSSTRSTTWVQGSLLSGSTVNISDVNFVVQDKLVTVTETKPTRRYGEFFLRQALKQKDVFESLRSRPLPKPKSATGNQTSTAAATGTGASQQSNATSKGGKSVAWAR